MKTSDLRTGQSHILRAIHLDRSSEASLVSQLVGAVEQLISDGLLRPGDKIPSVRCVARELQVSTFTVVEANERLLAAGRLHSRRGSGYFVARQGGTASADACSAGSNFPSLGTWNRPPCDAGAGLVAGASSGLPADWYGDGWIQEATRRAMRAHPDRLLGRGDDLGLPDLRRLLAQRLRSNGMDVDEYRVLLTGGATQACDLLLRTLCQPGDRILLEDPCSPTLRALVALHGCVALPVRRGADGLDLDALAELATRESPKLAFIQTVAQNPLGTTLSPSQVYRLLGLAERFDVLIVENDMYREVCPPGLPSLTAMDALKRVVRVDSTITTLSPLLRVGSICAEPTLISRLARTKVATGGGGARLEERVACQVIGSSEYRRMVARLQTRLDSAMASGIEHLRDLGLKPIAQPAGGLFVCARPLSESGAPFDEATVVRDAKGRGIALASGSRFSVSASDEPWFRINVAQAVEHADRGLPLHLPSAAAARDPMRSLSVNLLA